MEIKPEKVKFKMSQHDLNRSEEISPGLKNELFFHREGDFRTGRLSNQTGPVHVSNAHALLLPQRRH